MLEAYMTPGGLWVRDLEPAGITPFTGLACTKSGEHGTHQCERVEGERPWWKPTADGILLRRRRREEGLSMGECGRRLQMSVVMYQGFELGQRIPVDGWDPLYKALGFSRGDEFQAGRGRWKLLPQTSEGSTSFERVDELQITIGRPDWLNMTSISILCWGATWKSSTFGGMQHQAILEMIDNRWRLNRPEPTPWGVPVIPGKEEKR